METAAEAALLRWRKKKALKPIQTAAGDGLNGVDAAELEEPLSPAARLFHEPDFNVHIIAEMGSKIPIDPHIVKDKLPHTLLKQPRFSSLQVKDENGNMKWVPTKVDLERHVIVPDLDPNMDSPDKFVEDYIADLSKVPVDFSKPLWDLHLLNVRTSQAAAVGVFRIHHSLGDGMSLMSLLLACTRKTSDPAALPTIPGAKKPDFAPAGKGFWWGLRLIWNTVVDVFMFLLTTLFLKDTETHVKGVPTPESARWRFIHRTVNLDDIKLVKNALKATINDVMMGITLAALSRYLNRKYGERKRARGSAEKKNHLPRNIRLRATLLVNTRPSTGIHALAEMMEKGTEAKWGNQIGYILLPFPVAVRDDPLDYIRTAKAIIDRKKHSLEAIGTSYIADFVIKLLGIKAAAILSHRAPTFTTMSFSNVVGPVEEICFYGHPMAYLAPGCFGQPNALMINCQSYINQMTFILSVDENTIPDSHDLCDDIEESLKLIKEAVIVKGLAKRDT
ncbi:wax ester synthase/diacylglycerol acyltransferase 11-like [Malania oleifera]|uniref:wax ester synthase/diacylglycerol acyltransferase 11-like n=1 Tax=Malania oleifera TaxID=397392 RepID=UPI0025AEB7E5|nr:wax ester synthase/diacylglycerol acyltransferase 11-like [Malania oleifera]